MEIKRSEREIDHPSKANANVENLWTFAFTPSVCFHRIVLDAGAVTA
jgi:hypothetical protein